MSAFAPKRTTLPVTLFIYKFSILIRMHRLLELCEIVLDSECDMWSRSKSINVETIDFGFQSKLYQDDDFECKDEPNNIAHWIYAVEYIRRLRYWFTNRIITPILKPRLNLNRFHVSLRRILSRVALLSTTIDIFNVTCGDVFLSLYITGISWPSYMLLFTNVLSRDWQRAIAERISNNISYSSLNLGRTKILIEPNRFKKRLYDGAIIEKPLN